MEGGRSTGQGFGKYELPDLLRKRLARSSSGVCGPPLDEEADEYAPVPVRTGGMGGSGWDGEPVDVPRERERRKLPRAFNLDFVV